MMHECACFDEVTTHEHSVRPCRTGSNRAYEQDGRAETAAMRPEKCRSDRMDARDARRSHADGEIVVANLIDTCYFGRDVTGT